MKLKVHIKRRELRGGVVLKRCLGVLIVFLYVAASVNAVDDRFTPCVPADKFIELKITAKTVATPARLVWVLTEVPTVDQVKVAPGDTPLKDRILEILQTIRDSGVEVGVGKGGNPQPGDPPQFELQLADLDSVRPGLEVILPAGLTSDPLPADVGQVFTVRLCLKYEVEIIESKVEIEIKTAASDNGALPGIPAFSLADANTPFVNTPQGTIPVHLSYAQQDLDDAHKDKTVTSENAAVAQVQRELLKVAATAFDKAVAQGLLGPNGKPLVDRTSGQAIATALQESLSKLYSLNGLDPKIRWAIVNPRVGLRDNTPAAPWIISITGLQLAQRVDVEVLKSPVEMEFDGSETEKKFDQKREKVREKLRAEQLPNFSAQPGHIVTTDDIEKDQARLLAAKDIVKSVGDLSSGPADITPVPQNLIYTVSRYLKAEKILNLKLGGGYAPEEHVTGNADFDETNMLGFSEAAKLGYAGGPQTQRIRFNFDKPFASADTAGWHVKTLSVNVQYFTDKDERFSNLTADEIAARETGSEARLSIGYDSFGLVDHAAADCLEDGDRKRTRFYFLATPVLGYRDVNVIQDDLLLSMTHIDKSLLPQARTQTTTLSLDSNIGFSHDFRKLKRPGLGLFNVYLQGQLQRGFRLFGADYHYNKIRTSLTSELLFGFISSRDILVRYNRLMGRGTRGTPLFELFRLGGAQSVRGLEEGEFIGRKISADQFEFGINSLLVWHLISRKPVAEMLLSSSCADGDDGASPGLPFDINNTYLKFFYDRGRINDPDSFLRSGHVKRVAQGYGVAFELRGLGGRNVNLSIGYARSPESALHKKGTIYTGVSYAF